MLLDENSTLLSQMPSYRLLNRVATTKEIKSPQATLVFSYHVCLGSWNVSLLQKSFERIQGPADE